MGCVSQLCSSHLDPFLFYNVSFELVYCVLGLDDVISPFDPRGVDCSDSSMYISDAVFVPSVL